MRIRIDLPCARARVRSAWGQRPCGAVSLCTDGLIWTCIWCDCPVPQLSTTAHTNMKNITLPNNVRQPSSGSNYQGPRRCVGEAGGTRHVDDRVVREHLAVFTALATRVKLPHRPTCSIRKRTPVSQRASGPAAARVCRRRSRALCLVVLFLGSLLLLITAAGTLHRPWI